MKQHIPCFLCGNSVEIKKTKKDKPYFICIPCGVQAFIREKKGIKIINDLQKSDLLGGNKENPEILGLMR